MQQTGMITGNVTAAVNPPRHFTILTQQQSKGCGRTDSTQSLANLHLSPSAAAKS